MSNNTFHNDTNNDDDSNIGEEKYYDENYSMNVSYNADTDTSKLNFLKNSQFHFNFFSHFKFIFSL